MDGHSPCCTRCEAAGPPARTARTGQRPSHSRHYAGNALPQVLHLTNLLTLIETKTSFGTRELWGVSSCGTTPEELYRMLKIPSSKAAADESTGGVALDRKST